MSAPIVWGREIAVDGVRPAWLAEDTEVQWFGSYRPDWSIGSNSVSAACAFGGNTSSFRLPADHFAYKALDAGFEPWGGGDAAPADWDGGEVLSRGGERFSGLAFGYQGVDADQWKFGRYSDPSQPSRFDIIGYRKRAEPVEQLTDTVTIARMTEAQGREWAAKKNWAPGRGVGDAIDVLRDLGLIREETDLERFARETGVEITDDNRAAIERALGWSAGR